MADATLVDDGDGPGVRLERQLADPPPVVWRALTERDELRRWFPCDVIVAGGAWTVGAAMTFVFPPEVIDMTLTGEVLALDEPTVLAFRWGEEVLRFDLTPDGSGTRLVLINRLAPGAAARNAAGWEDCLDALAGGSPSPDGWRTRFDAYAAAFATSLGPQEGPPEGSRGDLG